MGIFNFMRGKANNNKPSDLTSKPAYTSKEDQNEMPYEIGEIINETFIIRKLLGRGGFGAVYLIEDKSDGDVYAIKTLLNKKNLDYNDEQNFLKEAKAWLGIGNHPYIIQLHQLAINKNRLLVVMENIPPDEDGLVTLHDHIKAKGKTLEDGTIALWSIQFCQGMSFAIKHGVIAHRDIKPQNILIDSFGFLKISDFGLAFVSEISKKTSLIGKNLFNTQEIQSQDGRITCGTPGYIAPELFRSELASFASDIFSFGVVLWQMAAGTDAVPYNVSYGGDINKFYRALYAEQMQHNVIRIQTVYWHIIFKCLNPDPNQRFRSFEELSNELLTTAKAAGVKTLNVIVNESESHSLGDLVNKGASYSLLGNFDKALELLNKAAHSNPKSPAVFINRGNMYSRMKNHHLALNDYNRAVELDEKNQISLANRASCYIELGQFDFAYSDLTNLLKLNARSFAGHCKMATVLSEMGKNNDAIKEVESAININNKDARAWIEYGRIFLRQNVLDKAFEKFNEAIRLNPLTLSAYLGQAEGLLVNGDKARALEIYKKASGLFEADFGSINEIATSMAKYGMHSHAIEYFEKSLKINNSQSYVQICNIGNVYKQIGDNAKAFNYFNKSIEINPKYALAYYLIGSIHHENGDYQSAIAFYEKATLLDPSSFDFWSDLGTARLQIDDAKGAVTCLRQALNINPRAVKILYNFAGALISLNNIADAKKSLTTAVKIKPDYAKAWYLKAQIEFQEKNYQDSFNSCASAHKYSYQLDEQDKQDVQVLLNRLLNRSR